MTLLNKIKCNEFLEYPDKHFREKKIVNFDIIYKSIRGEKIPEDDLNKYQAVKNSRVNQYPKNRKISFYLLHLEQTGKTYILRKKLLVLILNHYLKNSYV